MYSELLPAPKRDEEAGRRGGRREEGEEGGGEGRKERGEIRHSVIR